MNETPVHSMVEKPVRVPAMRHDAFFYTPANRDFLRGTRDTLKIADDPTRGKLEWNWLPLLIMGGVAVVIVLPYITLQTLPIAVLTIGGALVLGIIAAVRAQGAKDENPLTRRFFKEGQILEGELVACSPYVGRERSPGFQVDARYRFQDPTGERLQGKVKRERHHLKGTQLPAPGTPVYVLYFSENEHYLL